MEVIHKTCYPPLTVDARANIDLYFHNAFGLFPMPALRDPSDGIQTHNPGNGKVKQTHSVYTYNVTMQTFRKRFQRKTTVANHGLKVTDSILTKADVDQRRKDRDRTRINGNFNVRLQVVGWASDQHIQYCKDNKLTIPDAAMVNVGISRNRSAQSTSKVVSNQR